MEVQHFPTVESPNFRDMEFWEMQLCVSSSAARWIIKRHVLVDLESSCGVDPCELAADFGETWNLRRLDRNQTARGEKTQARFHETRENKKRTRRWRSDGKRCCQRTSAKTWQPADFTLIC